MNDAIRGILLVAEHAVNAEVWNLGGTKEYPTDQVKKVAIFMKNFFKS